MHHTCADFLGHRLPSMPAYYHRIICLWPSFDKIAVPPHCVDHGQWVNIKKRAYHTDATQSAPHVHTHCSATLATGCSKLHGSSGPLQSRFCLATTAISSLNKSRTPVSQLHCQPHTRPRTNQPEFFALFNDILVFNNGAGLSTMEF